MSGDYTRRPYWNADEAGDYMRVSRWVVYELVKRGRLKAARIGGGRRLVTTKQWVDEYVASRVAVAEPLR